MPKLSRHLLILIIPSLFTHHASAADKSSYSLINPVPAEQLRELSTDRPDRTESPYSVDPGHFQFEIDLVNSTIKGNSSDTVVAGINAKAGLTESIDLQVIAESLVINSSESDSKNGYGDTTIRLKGNLYGNDDGDTALAIMPYYTIPTRSDEIGASTAVLGAAIPFAYSLPENISGGIMLEPSLSLSGEGTVTDRFNLATMATFSREIYGDLGGFVEFYNEISSSPWLATLDLGLTWGMTSNLQWDIGSSFGLTSEAEDVNLFAGVSFRL